MLQLSRPILLTIAFALALTTALIVRSWVEASRSHPALQTMAQEAPKPAAKMVLVASTTLPAGHFLKTADMTWQSWPNTTLMPEYIVQGAHANEETLVGSVVRSGIAAGEPITAGRLVKKGDRGFLAAVLTPGFRAVTVPLTAKEGLSGLVVPGDRVDVILTTQVPGVAKEAPRRVSETVLGNIRVLAIDQRLDDKSSEAVMAHTVTLEVTPKQAEILPLVGEMGKLSMALRSISSPDHDLAAARPTMTWDNEATGLGQKGPAAGESGARLTVTRGTKDTTVAFPRGAQ